MNNTNFKYKLYVGIALVLSVISAVMRTVLLFFYYDKDTNYYSHGALLPTIHTVFLCAAVVFAASSLIATKKDELSEKKFHTSGIFIFSSSLSAFTLIASLVLTLTKSNISTLEKIAAFTAAPAALYFISMFIKNAEAAKLRTLFGFFVPIWGTLNLAAVYFDSYVAINAPNKIIEQMAFISVMLFFLYELRIHLNKQKPRLHLFMGMLALVFTATASFPGIIAATLGAIGAKYLAYDVVFAAMFIYICTIMLSKNKEDGGM